MAWSWSHTQEAYQAAYDNLTELPIEQLRVIYAECKAAKPTEYGEPAFRKSVYARELRAAKKLAGDILADAIWEYAEELATCDSGGHNAWVCPWGCHTVPFTRVNDADNQD